MVHLHSGDPIPSRFFPLLTQYLQVSQTLTQHASPTLSQVTAALKQPPDAAEQRLLEAHCLQRFNAQPHTLLSSAQVQDLLSVLFKRRAEHLLTENEKTPQPLWSTLPPILQSVTHHPVFSALSLLILVMVLVWVFF